jgi:hypothetical protein
MTLCRIWRGWFSAVPHIRINRVTFKGLPYELFCSIYRHIFVVRILKTILKKYIDNIPTKLLGAITSLESSTGSLSSPDKCDLIRIKVEVLIHLSRVTACFLGVWGFTVMLVVVSSPPHNTLHAGQNQFISYKLTLYTPRLLVELTPGVASSGYINTRLLLLLTFVPKQSTPPSSHSLWNQPTPSSPLPNQLLLSKQVHRSPRLTSLKKRRWVPLLQ